MDWALNNWMLLYGLILGIYIPIIGMLFRTKKMADNNDAVVDEISDTHERLTDALTRLEQAVDVMGVANLPRDGFPQHMEAAWEDIGAKGRFLTDLGGMSIEMRLQMMHEFYNALNKTMPCTPAAGSFNDVMADLDAWLTLQAKQKDDEFVMVRKKKGDGQ